MNAMKKHYFMLAYSAFFAITCALVSGIYFEQKEYDKAVFCLVCALANVGCGYVWHLRIVNKKINGNESK